MKCNKNEAFPELVEKKYWKEVLNLLGERRGNANNVGDDSVVTEVKEHNALYAISASVTFCVTTEISTVPSTTPMASIISMSTP